jgi:hypothetical protein
VSIAILPLPIKGGRLKAMSCLLILDLLKVRVIEIGPNIPGPAPAGGANSDGVLGKLFPVTVMPGSDVAEAGFMEAK